MAFRLKSALSILLILLHIYAFSQENQPVASDSAVSGIQFDGLKRTKESYLLSVLEKYVGVPGKNIDLNSVKITLEELGLFSEAEVSLKRDENGKTLLFIKVKEKFSFLPIPFFMYSTSTGFMGGAFVMDTNAFGIRDNYIVGGIFSKTIQMGLMAYARPSRDARHPGFSVDASFTHRDNDEKDLYNRKILEYNIMRGSLHASINSRLTEHFLVFAGLRYDYAHLDVDKDYREYENEFRSFHAFSPNIGWNLSFSELNDWFLSAKSLKVNSDMTFLTSGKISESVSLKLSIQQPLPVIRLRVLTQYAIYWSNNLPLALRPSQRVVGTTIMPDKFHGTKMAGINAGLEVGIFKTNFVAFSAYGLFEQFAGEDFDSSLVMNFGYSAGLKMYLKKFAFPAISVGISHNLMQNDIKFAMTVGVGGF